MNALTEGLNLVAGAVAGTARRTDRPPMWATVLTSTPPQVTLDDDPDATPLDVASSGIGPLTTGTKVLVQIGRTPGRRRVTILSTPTVAPALRSAAGTATFTLSTTVTTHNVALPAGRFTGAPIVIPSLTSGTQRCRVDNISAVAFRIVVWDATTMTGTASVGWHAIATH